MLIFAILFIEHSFFPEEIKMSKSEQFSGRYQPVKFRGYPVGTVAYYGPDDKTITKIAVGIIRGDNQECSEMRRWAGSDVTHDRKAQQEISDFLKHHRVKTTIITKGPIGCIHEEGPDYPVGEECPFCPFWNGKQ